MLVAGFAQASGTEFEASFSGEAGLTLPRPGHPGNGGPGWGGPGHGGPGWGGGNDTIYVPGNGDREISCVARDSRTREFTATGRVHRRTLQERAVALCQRNSWDARSCYLVGCRVNGGGGPRPPGPGPGPVQDEIVHVPGNGRYEFRCAAVDDRNRRFIAIGRVHQNDLRNAAARLCSNRSWNPHTCRSVGCQ